MYMILKRRIHYQMTDDITITGLEPTYPSLQMTNSVLCSVSIVTVFPTTCPVFTCPVPWLP